MNNITIDCFFSAKIVISMADSDVQKVLKAVVATRVSGRSRIEELRINLGRLIKLP